MSSASTEADKPSALLEKKSDKSKASKKTASDGTRKSTKFTKGGKQKDEGGSKNFLLKQFLDAHLTMAKALASNGGPSESNHKKPSTKRWNREKQKRNGVKACYRCGANDHLVAACKVEKETKSDGMEQ